MVGVEGMQKRSSGTAWLVWGIILLVLGIIGIVVFFVGANIPSAGDSQGSSVWQSLSVILGALFFGFGLMLLVFGLIKRRKFHRG